MFLASTSDVVRVVTGSGVSTIGVQAAWVDNAVGTYTPGSTNTNITTATTTTIVAAPAASTVRNVKSLRISNNSTTSSCLVTVQHFDGATSVDIEKITLAAGECFDMAEDGEWRHLTAAGGEYEAEGAAAPSNWGLGISGTVAETMPREICQEANAAALTSGVLRLDGVYLKAGQVVTSISYFSATTAAGTPTNQFFALYGMSRELLAQSANDTTTAWAANTIKTLAMTAPYTIRKSGLYYIGIMVSATTVPTLKGVAITTGNLAGFQIPAKGSSTTGLTTALPAAAGAMGLLTSSVWAAIT